MKQKGFSLIELLVIIGIIGILSTVVVINMNKARSKARDAFRKASLLEVQAALEMYYKDHHAYPLITNGYWQGDAAMYGGFCYYDGCGGAGPYIAGLAPQYISRLPAEPLLGKYVGICGVGFLYRSDGTDYKFLAHCSPENGYQTTDKFYDPSRPGWAWQVSSPGAINW